MNEIARRESSDELITTKQLAEQLGTRPNVITENAKKCLPNKKIENGKATYWNKEEVTVMLEYLKNNNSNQFNLSRSLIGTSTDLTPALKLKKALELAQEAYEEELAILKSKNERLESENGNLKIELDESKEWSTIQKWCNENGFSFNRKELAKISLRMGRMGFERRKIYSVEYQNGLWSYRKSDIEDFFEKELEKGLA